MDNILDRKFRVYFKILNIDKTADVQASVEFTGLLGNVLDGFWIDKDFEYIGCDTDYNKGNGTWFVPSSQIIGIVRAE